MGQFRRSARGVPRHLGSPPGTVRRFQPRPGDGSGHPAHRAVRSRQLSLPGPAARPSPDRVLRRGAALPRRLDAPGHRGLCVSRRGGGRRAGIPDLLVSELARPGHQPGADARGSLGLSVAERDLPEGRSGRGLLQHGASPAGPGIPAQPRWASRYRTPGGGGRGPEHRPPAPAGRHRFPGDRLPPWWRRAGPASGSPEVAGRRRPDAPRTGNADRPAGIFRGSAHHRPDRSPGAAGEAVALSVRPAHCVAVRFREPVRARPLRCAAPGDFGRHGRPPVQHAEPPRLRSAPLLHRGVAHEGADPATRRDLPGGSRRDRSDAAREDGGQRRGGGSDSRRRPGRVVGDHHRTAPPRQSGRVRPVALRRGLGRGDGPHLRLLDGPRDRRLRALPQPLRRVRTRSGHRDLHRLPDDAGRIPGRGGGALLGHQLAGVELDGHVERHGRLRAARRGSGPEPPALPQPGPAALGAGGDVVRPAGVRRHPDPPPSAAEGPVAERPPAPALRRSTGLPGLAALLRRPGRRPGTRRRGGGQGLLAAQRRDVDRLPDAVGLPRGARPRTRPAGAHRLGVRRLHVREPPGPRLPRASHHRAALGPDRMDARRRAPRTR